MKPLSPLSIKRRIGLVLDEIDLEKKYMMREYLKSKYYQSLYDEQYFTIFYTKRISRLYQKAEDLIKLL